MLFFLILNLDIIVAIILVVNYIKSVSTIICATTAQNCTWDIQFTTATYVISTLAKKSAMESWWYFIFSTFSFVWSSRNYNVCDHVCVSLLCSDKCWVEWVCKTKCQGEILPLTYDWVRYNLTKPIFFACLFHVYNYMPYLSNCNIQHSILLKVQ